MMEHRQKKIFLLSALAMLLFSQSLAGCLPAVRNTAFPDKWTDAPQSVRTATMRKRPAYKPPAIPATLTDISQRFDYLAMHYWDNFPMSDTSYIDCSEVTEQALADYLCFLDEVSPRAAEQGLQTLLGKALTGNKQMYYHFSALLERYLYEPGSPVHNEERYIGVLRNIATLPGLSEADKYRPAWQLTMALKNRPGEKAAGFGYRLRDGRKGHLRDFRAAYTLLLFFNPDCPSCKEVAGQLQRFAPLTQALAVCRLRVLAIYAGQDTQLWEKYKDELPAEWHVGYNSPRDILSKELYDLRTTPTLYLLDTNKRVILKNTSVEAIAGYFTNPV